MARTVSTTTIVFGLYIDWLTFQGRDGQMGFYSPALHSMWVNTNANKSYAAPAATNNYYPPTPPRSSSDSKSDDFSVSSGTSSVSNSTQNNNTIDSLKDSYMQIEHQYQQQSSLQQQKRPIEGTKLDSKSETASEVASTSSCSPPITSSSVYPYFTPTASELASPYYGSYATTKLEKPKAKSNAAGKNFACKDTF